MRVASSATASVLSAAANDPASLPSDGFYEVLHHISCSSASTPTTPAAADDDSDAAFSHAMMLLSLSSCYCCFNKSLF